MYLLELGGEDDAFAAREAASACSGVERLATGLATARGYTDRVAGLAYTHAVSELVGTTDATVSAAEHLLTAATIDREGTVAVRARNVQATADVSTQIAERTLGGVLTDRGFDVDLDSPDHELRVLFADDVVAVGWLEAESVRDFGERRPTDRPFFQPGSMDPLLARAIANIAGARPGRTVLDPMCGTGGVLIEAGLVGADVLGNDAQWKMSHGARENLAASLDTEGISKLPTPGSWNVLRGDATRLPLRDGAADCVVFDAPYGRQSKIENRSLDTLVADALSESRRVADRGVLVADREWDGAARAAGWDVTARFVRPVHGTLDRHILVLA